MHAFDRQTDRRTDRRTEISSQDCVCIPCSAVKRKWHTGAFKSLQINGRREKVCWQTAAPRPTQPYISPVSVNEYHLPLGRQRNVADVRGGAGKTVRSFENACHTRAPIRGVFTTGRYINPRLPLPYLYFHIRGPCSDRIYLHVPSAVLVLGSFQLFLLSLVMVFATVV